MAERKQGDKEPSPFERALKWIGAAMGPVLAFSKIVELPLPYQILLIVVAVLLAVVSIFVLRKKEIIIVVLMALLGFALMTGIAAVLKPLLDRFTPKTSYAEKIYYMVVLDASENMNLPFEGSGSRWEAAQAAVNHFLTRSHKDSNYGLVTIGGQNRNETGSVLCEIPTASLIPLVSKKGSVLENLSLINFQTTVQDQRPEGGGSFIKALSLAKDQLLDLPSDLDAKRIIIVIASARDCTGEIDWVSLKEEVVLAHPEIAIPKAFILMDDSSDPKAVEFAEQ